jgi:hypothetical protein
VYGVKSKPMDLVATGGAVWVDGKAAYNKRGSVQYRSRGERICCRSHGRELLRGRQHTHLGPLHPSVSRLCPLLLVLPLKH